MNYIITGDYPDYTVTGNGSLITRASDFASLMEYFKYHMEHGDTITWE